MAFTDLSASAQEGLAYLANTVLKGDGTPLYANARAVADAVAEREGAAAYEQKLAMIRARRQAKLEKPANAALAAQVDAAAGN